MTEYTTLGNLISPAKVIRCGNGSYPVLSMTMHDGIVLQSDRFKKSLASADQSDYKVVKYGQLVVGFPIDEGVLYIQKATNEGIMSPAYNVWDVDTLKVEADYLELCLHSPQAMQYYCDKLRGSTARRRSIPTADLLALPIRLPTLEEQREKLEMMAKMNALIADRHQQLDLTDQLVKSRFIEMFDGKGYPQVTIGELVTSKVPSVKKSFAPTDLIKYIDISSIDNIRNVMTGYTEYVLQEAPSRAQQHIKTGDIVISTVRPNLKNVAITTYEDDNLVASSGFCVLRANKCLPSYLMAIVCSEKFTEAMIKLVTGANYPAIKDSDVLNYVVALPPIKIQEQFAAFVEQTDKSKFYIQHINEIYLLIIKKLSWRVKHDYN